jgi:NADH:ubiquinone oxidoreductase subunit F (NADH-binding)
MACASSIEAPRYVVANGYWRRSGDRSPTVALMLRDPFAVVEGVPRSRPIAIGASESFIAVRAEQTATSSRTFRRPSRPRTDAGFLGTRRPRLRPRHR